MRSIIAATALEVSKSSANAAFTVTFVLASLQEEKVTFKIRQTRCQQYAEFISYSARGSHQKDTVISFLAVL